jgi:hypothetical protein
LTLLALAAPASFFSPAASSHFAKTSFSHFVTKDVRAAPKSFFSFAAVMQALSGAGSAAYVKDEKAIKARVQSFFMVCVFLRVKLRNVILSHGQRQKIR